MPDSSQTGGNQPVKGEPSGPVPSLKRVFAILFIFATFCFWMALYVYAPILPVYTQSLGASMTMVGIVVASYALPQLVLRIPMGLWSDAMGRRKIFVLTGFMLNLAGALGLWLAPNPLILTLARTTVGMGAAVWVILLVYYVSFFPAEKTGRAVGFLNFVQSSGMVLASLAGGIVAEAWGSRQTFLLAAGLAALAFFAMIPVPERRPQSHTSFHWQGLAEVAFQRNLIVVCVMGILVYFAQFATVFGFIPVYGASIGASKTELGVITMLATLSGAISALLAPRITERKGFAYVVLIGSLVMGLSLVAVPFISSVLVLEVDQFITGLGRGMLSTTLMAQSIYGIPPHQRATAMGIYQAVYSIGMLTGPLLSGFLADSLGLATVFYLCTAISLLVAVVAYLPLKPKD